MTKFCALRGDFADFGIDARNVLIRWYPILRNDVRQIRVMRIQCPQSLDRNAPLLLPRLRKRIGEILSAIFLVRFIALR